MELPTDFLSLGKGSVNIGFENYHDSSFNRVCKISHP